MIGNELPCYQARIDAIRNELDVAALDRWGRSPQIIAVSKNVPVERINPVKDVGIVTLGENRVQELIGKYPHLDSSFDIDFIGRLQSNKVKYIIDKVRMIQSLDRVSLAQEIDRRAQQHARCMPVLIQVNIGRESQKGGIDPDEVLSFARFVAKLSGMRVRGLMAVMPDTDDNQQLRECFVKMRSLFERLKAEAIANTQIDELSMGMSGDYRMAAQEGATIVRIGSAIFGSRNM